MPDNILLALHVIAGAVALLTAVIGIASKAPPVSHRVHVIAGTTFVVSMAIISVTGLPLAYLKGSLFLLMIGLFSGYLTWSGWLYARNRAGRPSSVDWTVVAMMSLVGVALIVYGAWSLVQGSTFGVVMIVFGGISLFLCNLDLQIFRAGGVTGKQRIAQHLTMMLGGTITALTAFSANILTRFLPAQLEPLAWLWPTAIIVPIIIIWGRRLEAGSRVSGM
jgi:hypothetical protein